jgi:hypothetical protein
VGEDFGTIVSGYSYARDQTGQKLLQQDGTYWRSGVTQGEKYLVQPWKNSSLVI